MSVSYPRALVNLTTLLENFDGGLDATTHTVAVVPRDVEIERNTYREADTFKLSLDVLDLPLDPRALRSCRVEILLGDAGGNDVELPDAPEFRAFQGFVDVPEVRLGAEGEIVELSGRDNTSLLLDHRWTGGAIDLQQPLSDVVDDILRQCPGAEEAVQEYEPGTAAIVLANVLGKTKYSPQPDDDAWTILVELCGYVGLLPTFDLDVLQIRTPATFGKRRVGFEYGRDVLSLRYRRKLNEVRTRQIEVRCWDDVARETRIARWPRAAIATKRKISAKGKVSTSFAPIVPWFVQGPYSMADLERIASTVYEDLARDELDGVLETREMRDGSGVPTWLLANGDRVDVRLGPRSLAALQAGSDAEALTALTAGPQGYDPTEARALLTALRKSELLASSFYVKKATHKWSRDDGYKLNLEFLNYVGNQATR